jgi:hypothetical protein
MLHPLGIRTCSAVHPKTLSSRAPGLGMSASNRATFERSRPRAVSGRTCDWAILSLRRLRSAAFVAIGPMAVTSPRGGSYLPSGLDAAGHLARAASMSLLGAGFPHWVSCLRSAVPRLRFSDRVSLRFPGRWEASFCGVGGAARRTSTCRSSGRADRAGEPCTAGGYRPSWCGRGDRRRWSGQDRSGA